MIMQIKIPNKSKTQNQLLFEYKQECKKNWKEISWDDFINNYVPNYLKTWWSITFEI